MNEIKQEIIGTTKSVCPICMKRLDAERVREGENIYIKKTCPEHGEFKVVIWRGAPDYLAWAREKTPERSERSMKPAVKGCPFDCGICPEHCQQICCAQIEVTSRCNMRCPVCFASAGDDVARDVPIDELLRRLQYIWDNNGHCNIQLSGGEPTVRDDLPELIERAREIGYTFFQLNTNGLRLADDEEYLERLVQAGVSTAFMQFDGTDDRIYRRLRGRELLGVKKRAIENCGKHGLGVVLVPTLTPGVNTDNIGEMVRFAVANMPTVRGVHFQPISYFGRYPVPPADEDRITLPEVMRAIETQTDGLIKAATFVPSDCESPVCSFHGDFMYMPDGSLKPMTRKKSCCCGKPASPTVKQAQNFVAKRWQLQKKAGGEKPEAGSLDELLERLQSYRLSITCMAFQDAWNLDLDRLKYCCVPVIAGEGEAIPFCAFNLTDSEGRSLYRDKYKG